MVVNDMWIPLTQILKDLTGNKILLYSFMFKQDINKAHSSRKRKVK